MVLGFSKKGGVAPRHTAESSSSRKQKKKGIAPDSLTYVDYKLVIDESGKKKYVSPEEAAQLGAERTVKALGGPLAGGSSKGAPLGTSTDYVQITNEHGKREYVTLDEAARRNNGPKALHGILRKAPAPPPVSTLDSAQSDSFKSIVRSSATTNYESPIESSVGYPLEPREEKDLREDDVDAGKKATTTELSLAGIPKVSKDVKVSDWLKDHREDLSVSAPAKEIHDVRDLSWIPDELGAPPPIPSPMELKKASVTVPLSSPKELKKADETSAWQKSADDSDSSSDGGEPKKFKRGWSEGSAAKKRGLFSGIFTSGRKARRITTLDAELEKKMDGANADSESSDSEVSIKKRKSKRKLNDGDDPESKKSPKKAFLGNLFGSKRERKVPTFERSTSEPGERKIVNDSFSVGDDGPHVKPVTKKEKKAKNVKTDENLLGDEKKTKKFFPLFKSKSSDGLKAKNLSVKPEERETKGLSDSELSKSKKSSKAYLDADLSTVVFNIEDRNVETSKRPRNRSGSSASSSDLSGDQENIFDVKDAKKVRRQFSFPFLWKAKGSPAKLPETHDKNKNRNHEKVLEQVRIDSVEPGENIIMVDNTNIKERDAEDEVMNRPYLASFLSIFTPFKKKPANGVLDDGAYYKKEPVVDAAEKQIDDVQEGGFGNVSENDVPAIDVVEKEQVEPPRSKSIGDIVKEILGVGSKDESVRVLSKVDLSDDKINELTVDNEHDKMRDIVNEIFRSNSEDSEKEERKRKKKVTNKGGKAKPKKSIFAKKPKKTQQTYVITKASESIGTSSDSEDKEKVPKRESTQERSFEEDTSSDDAEADRVKTDPPVNREARRKPLKVFFGAKGTYRRSEDLDLNDDKKDGKKTEGVAPRKSLLAIFGSNDKTKTEGMETSQPVVEQKIKDGKKSSMDSLSELEDEEVKEKSADERNKKPKKTLMAMFGSKDKMHSKGESGNEMKVDAGTEPQAGRQKSKKGLLGLFGSKDKVESDSSSSDEGSKHGEKVENEKVSEEPVEIQSQAFKKSPKKNQPRKGILAMFGSSNKVKPDESFQRNEAVTETDKVLPAEEVSNVNEGKKKLVKSRKSKSNRKPAIFRSKDKAESESSSSSSTDDEGGADENKVKKETKKESLSVEDRKVLKDRNANIRQLKSIVGSKDHSKEHEQVEKPSLKSEDGEVNSSLDVPREAVKEKPSKSTMLKLLFGSKETQDKSVSLDELKKGKDANDKNENSSETSSVTSDEEDVIKKGKGNKKLSVFVKKEKSADGHKVQFLRNKKVEVSEKNVKRGFYEDNIKKANKKNNRKGFYDFSSSNDYIEPKSPKKEIFFPYFLPRNESVIEDNTSTSSGEEVNEDLIVTRPAVGVWGPKRNEKQVRTSSWEFDEENEPVVLKAWKQLDEEGKEVRIIVLQETSKKSSLLQETSKKSSVLDEGRKRPSSLLIPKNDKKDKEQKSRPLSLFDAHMTRSSDTESADHGSTDKSSISKLTQNRSNKPKFGFLDLLKRPKDKVMDIEDLKVVAEAKENELAALDGHGRTNADGVVYAELDIVRSAEVSTRAQPEPEKTEYAEIIHPNPRSAKKATEDLKKSRENLAGSREALNDPDPDVITTPEGKKEAAV